MKKKLLLIMLLGLFVFSGCDLFKPNQDHLLVDKPNFRLVEDIDKTIEVIDTNTKEINEKTDSISTSAQEIYNTATTIPSDIPEESKTKIEPKIEFIKEESKSIIEDSKEITKATINIEATKNLLDGTKIKAKETDDTLKNLVKEKNALTKKLKKAEEARDSALHKTLQWLIVGCIVCCGVFIALFFFTGSKGGLIAASGCGLILLIAIFVDMYIIYLAIGGGILLLAMVGWLLYNIYVKNKAFKEVVSTVEIAQDNMPEETKNILFGGENKTGIMDSIQSPTTMDLVRKEKNRISSLWLYAKNKGERENTPT